MSDIVERLREPYDQTQSRRAAIEREAADEIERLRIALEWCRDETSDVWIVDKVEVTLGNLDPVDAS